VVPHAVEKPPRDIVAIRNAIDVGLNARDDTDRRIGDSKYGVYVFYDFDGEPIYAGQTSESLRTRIRRHLTNQRTDAVAMHVLDPLEVADVEVWPLWELQEHPEAHSKEVLAAAEYTVYEEARAASRFKALLNEADITPTPLVDLPSSHRFRIIPDAEYERLRHPDVRIARRARTIYELASVISERAVSKGLRRTLVTQARRLESLARERLIEVGGTYPVEELGEETGETAKPAT
jgi:hypothetical protein